MKSKIPSQPADRSGAGDLAWTLLSAFLLIGGGLLAVVFSWALSASQWPVAQTTNPARHYAFELFGFFGSLYFLSVFTAQWWRSGRAEPAALLKPIAGLLISLVFLTQIAEYHEVSYDYKKYEEGAQALMAGNSPYGKGYLYPPLPAQAMTLTYRAANFLRSYFDTQHDPKWGWPVVYFVYECGQVFLLAALFYLLVCLGQLLSLREPTAVFSSAVVLLASSPIVRSLKHNQINFWVLLSALGAMVLADSAPLAAGVLLALGIHIKLYPAILLAAFALTGRWKVVGYCLGAFALIFIVQTSLLSDLEAWKSFFQFSKTFPKGRLFRDNGLHGIVYNLFALPHGFKRAAADKLLPTIDRVYYLCVAVTALAFAYRIYIRERLWNRARNGFQAAEEFRLRLVPHCCDLLAFSLLCSPLVWEHHYVMAMPMLILLVAIVDYRRSWIPLAVLLGFQAFPTIEVFPFSYTRVAALLLFLYVTRPQKISPPVPAGERMAAAGVS